MSAVELSRSPSGFVNTHTQAATTVGSPVFTARDENTFRVVDSSAAARTASLPSAATVPIGWSMRVQRRGAGNAVTVDLVVATDSINGAVGGTFAIGTNLLVATVVKVGPTDYAVY